MLGIIEKITAGFILSYVLILFWSLVLNKKINYRKSPFYICLVSLTLVSTINHYLFNNFIKIIIISVFMIISCLKLFKTTLKESVLTIFIEQIIFMISDGIIVILFTFIFNLDVYSANIQLSSILINLVESIIALILFYLLFVRKLYQLTYKLTNKIKTFEVIILCFCIIIFADIFGVALYNKVDFRIFIVINIVFTLFCLIIVLYSLKNKNNYNKVYDKYNTTLNSLKEYELVLDKQRISNHENKNQLLMIRNMLSSDNEKIKNYIDKILENKLIDDDKIMSETFVIPTGGLRGLIYSKLLSMKNLKINYQLIISKEISTLNLLELDDDLMLDICKIIGVYLDNAINAVKRIRKKYITIEMYKENNMLVISVSNNYIGKIDIEKLDEVGYSNTGNGHGYGLPLTKKIISENKKLMNEKKLSKNVFTQILKIKL